MGVILIDPIISISIFIEFIHSVLVRGGGGGVATQKTEKTSPKFIWFIFGLNFDKKFQPFKNHVNNEVLGGQELPNNTLNAYKALQMSYKRYYNQQEPLITRTR